MDRFDVGRVPPMMVGAGCLVDVPDAVALVGGSRVLVVADAIMADLGVTDRLAGILAADGLHAEIAANVAGEPKDALVDDLVVRAAQSGCDCVIGLGGGAAMDAAKLTAAIARAGEPALHYALCAHAYPADRLPCVGIPTTAGTGSEVTRTAIISNAAGSKYWYWGEELMFAYAVLDPELTLSMPPHITAWTGMDAVAHALESVTSKSSNPVGRHFGLPALALLAAWLPRAVADGQNVEARGHVLWGATLAGLALHNCNTHMGHNISHALGSLAPVHHGLATGLALAVTLPWLVGQPEGAENYALAAEALGGEPRAEALPEAFAGLMSSCGVSEILPGAAHAVTAEDLAAEMAVPYNRGMANNAACDVTDEDLDQMAAMLLDLPKAEMAA